MWGRSISERVQKAIKQRVADAQAEHDAEVKHLEEQLERDKEIHAEHMVEKIIGQR